MTDVNVWLSKTTKRVNRWDLQLYHSSSTILRSQLRWPLVFTTEYLRQYHIYPMWLTKSAGGFHVHLMHLYIFKLPFAHFHLSAIAVCLCFRDAFISQQLLWRPGGNIRAEAFRSNHGESGYAGHTVTGQVYTPTPLQNVNYLIRFTETASGRRKRVRGPVCGTRTSVGGSRRGSFRSVAPYRAVLDPWFLLLISHWAGNSTWRGWERNWTVLFSPPLFLSSTCFISLFHILSSQHICKCCRMYCWAEDVSSVWKDRIMGRNVFRAKLPLVNITSVPIDLCIHELWN